LASPTTTCRALPNFPKEIWNSVGGLGLEDQPLICGGFNGQYNNGCFSLEGNKWISSTPLSSTRINAVASMCPYQINSHKILVTGGFNKVDGFLDTSEVLTDNGWQPFHLTLPTATESHCVVSLNSTTIMLIGGFENEKNSYYFNSDDEEWVKGKRLSTFPLG
jgi:hypothetical protein